MQGDPDGSLAPDRGARVLVVDDDEGIRRLIVELLEDEGYRAIPAIDGREAIARLCSQSEPPDMMLLDLLMPEVDGYAVLDYLRRTGRVELPVVIFSAQHPDATVLDALDSELRDFIAKPFELEELLIRMQRLFRRAPRPGAPRTATLRVYQLGSLRVYRDDTLLFDESWRNKPAKTIFKLLFSEPGQRYPKDVLAEQLWPNTDPSVAANRLRVAIHELRKVLQRGQKEKTASGIAQQEGAYYFDEGTPHWSDVRAFEGYLQRGQELAASGRLEDALQAYEQAEALYQGDYLRDDLFLEWTATTRERLREAHLSMLADVGRPCALLCETNEEARWCRRILLSEPWREGVARRLMEYLVAAGRPNEALRAFEECRRALRAEVEADPSPETVQLRDSIAARTYESSAVSE